MSESNPWLPEQLKTIKNLCEVAQILIYIEFEEYLPTILETMFEQCQQILDENCVKTS